MQRVRSIDVFRGLAIVLMVLFSLMIKLTPEAGFFEHNRQGEVHPGDFVLTLFLFASGMSIVFYVKKREKLKRIVYQLDVIERFGKLFGIGMLLSLFSAGVFFGMDEVSLSAILFVLTVLSMGFSNLFYVVLSALLAILYFAIFRLGLATVFDSAYLGGYWGALFYLPVMLAGAVLGKAIAQGSEWRGMKALFVLSLAASVALMLVFPIDKPRVSPSFMAVSVLAATALFAGIHLLVERKKMEITVLEFLGKRPIMYWLLMFAFFIIPYGFCVAFGVCSHPLQLPLPVALVVAAVYMVLLAVVSGLMQGMKNKGHPSLILARSKR